MLDRRAPRPGTRHLLTEERRIAGGGSVVVSRGPEDQPAHRIGPARLEQLRRVVQVDLARPASRGEQGIGDQPRVDHGVDPHRLDDPAQLHGRHGGAHEFDAGELVRRVLGVDPDDGVNPPVRLQRLGEPPAQPRGNAGDEDSAGDRRVHRSPQPHAATRRHHLEQALLNQRPHRLVNRLDVLVGRHRSEETELELGREWRCRVDR